MAFDYFPSYTDVSEGDEVELPSGKTFVYQISTTGFPGRYRAFSKRTELEIGGLNFGEVEPIKVAVQPGTEVDPDTGETLETRDVTYRIDVQTLPPVI